MKQDGMPAALESITLPRQTAPASEWVSWLTTAEEAFRAVPADAAGDQADAWWMSETRHRIDALLALLRNYMPWMLPEFAGLKELSQQTYPDDVTRITIHDAAEFADALERGSFRGGPELIPSLEQLIEAMPEAKRNLHQLIEDLHKIADGSERLAEQADFSLFVDPARQDSFDRLRHGRHGNCIQPATTCSPLRRALRPSSRSRAAICRSRAGSSWAAISHMPLADTRYSHGPAPCLSTSCPRSGCAAILRR